MKSKIIEDMHSQLSILTAEVKRQGQNLGKLSTRMRRINVHQVETDMNAMAEDAKTLHLRLQMMILKITVCTECSYLVRNKYPHLIERLHHALMWGFDQPDEWWIQFEKIRVGLCVEKIIVGWALENKVAA